MATYLKPAFLMLTIWTVLLGLVYPALVTGLAQLLFPRQANGSLILDPAGNPLGSELIGQPFSDPKYFWGRPSATSPYPYNAQASSGSNLGPTNPVWLDAVKARIQALRQIDPDNKAPIPVDLVTASSSGLDPHISLAAAAYQIDRVAKARRINPARLQALVQAQTEPRQLGLFGEPRVNILKLNLALDRLPR